LKQKKYGKKKKDQKAVGGNNTCAGDVGGGV
jgi:hypothetical protein